MKLPLLVLSLFLSITAHAQSPVCSSEWSSKAELDCQVSDPKDISRCMTARANDAGAEMDRIVQVLKSDLVRPADLLGAQRAWGDYRKQECGYQSSGAACDSGKSGSACSVAAARCQMRLTCERVTLLRQHMGNICTDCPPRKSAGR